MGYVTAMIEYAAQAAALGAFDAHVFATSSGGTQAGMVLGAHLAGLGSATRILGISVDRPRDALAADVASLASQGAALLGADWRIDARDILIDDGYRGGGYAVIGEPGARRSLCSRGRRAFCSTRCIRAVPWPA